MNSTVTATIISSVITSMVMFATYDKPYELDENRISVGKVTGESATESPSGIRNNAIKFALMNTGATLKVSESERKCLAMNAFHEAGVEGHMGMIAVLQVTHARAKTSRWGTDFCKVVYAKAQFSWTLEKKKIKATPDGPLWSAAKQAVDAYLRGQRIMGLGDALYYHTDYIKAPKWASDDRHQLGSIGRHIFYIRDIKQHEITSGSNSFY